MTNNYRISACIVLLGVVLGCGNEPVVDTFDLGQGVIAKIESVRAWQTYDGCVPEEASSRHWLTDAGAFTPMPTYYGSSGKLCAGDRKVEVGDEGYSTSIEAFSDYDEGIQVAADDRFVEVVLRLENLGQESQTRWLIDEGNSQLPIFVGAGESTHKVRAFLLPGADICRLSLMSAWQGRLGFSLDPGETSWVLLVFDLADTVVEAQLHLLDNQAIPFSVPQFAPISPAATVFRGPISMESQFAEIEAEGHFENGEFSITFSEDREAVIGFSLTLGNLSYVVNGESGSTEQTTIAFEEFSRPLLNSYIFADIPRTYIVEGYLTSATQASGTINIYFDTRGDAGILDLGKWHWQATADTAG